MTPDNHGQTCAIYYDREADAIYATFPGKEDVSTMRTEAWAGDLCIDYDASGFIVGIEILGVSKLPPPPPEH